MVILSPSKKDFKSRDVNLSIIDNYVLCHNVLIYNEVWLINYVVNYETRAVRVDFTKVI